MGSCRVASSGSRGRQVWLTRGVAARGIKPWIDFHQSHLLNLQQWKFPWHSAPEWQEPWVPSHVHWRCYLRNADFWEHRVGCTARLCYFFQQLEINISRVLGSVVHTWQSVSLWKPHYRSISLGWLFVKPSFRVCHWGEFELWFWNILYDSSCPSWPLPPVLNQEKKMNLIHFSLMCFHYCPSVCDTSIGWRALIIEWLTLTSQIPSSSLAIVHFL